MRAGASSNASPDADAVRCPECGYRNNKDQTTCYACGSAIEAKQAVAGPPVRLIFKERSTP